jgi:hypothetical protein
MFVIFILNKTICLIEYFRFSAMYGQANTHVIRLAAIIHAIEVAYSLVLNLNHPNKFELTDEFKIAVTLAIDAKGLVVSTINEASILAAKKLMEYYLFNRLVLAGYRCNLIFNTNELNINFILNSLKYQPSLEEDEQCLKIVKTIFETPGVEVSCAEINQRKKIPSAAIQSAFLVLKKLNLGSIIEEKSNKSGKGISRIIFRKHPMEMFVNNMDLVLKLEQFRVDYQTYASYYNQAKDSSPLDELTNKGNNESCTFLFISMMK